VKDDQPLYEQVDEAHARLIDEEDDFVVDEGRSKNAIHNVSLIVHRAQRDMLYTTALMTSCLKVLL
jgi:hypothetical protein